MKRKRWAALVLAVLLCLSLAGCRRKNAPVPAATASTPPVSAAPVSDIPPPASEAPAPVHPAPAETADPKGNQESSADPKGNQGSPIDPNGAYDSAEEVARYLQTYGELPGNYITKDEAEDLGWHGGPVERYAPGMCIGGDRFSNREGLLPKANGRTWTECDIDTLGGNSRGSKRLVYSNDGLIYYTDDHYESFQRLYP